MRIPLAAARPCAVLVLAAAVLSACSHATAASPSSPSTSSGASAPATSPSTGSPPAAQSPSPPSAAVQRCTTDELSAGLTPGSPGAGQRYATLVLTNTSDRTCSVFGYGGVGLVAADGSALPTHQVRVSEPPPATVVLRPGGTVDSQLHWSVVPGAGDASTGQCQPAAVTLRVIPPDETTALSVPWNLGAVCEAGTIDQQAYSG
jgi:hypothetical protein